MTRDQYNAAATYCFQFWVAHAGFKPWHAVGLLTNTADECSFNPLAKGDDDSAFGFGQWHENRAEVILNKTGIDVKTADIQHQLLAMLWELQNVETVALKDLLATNNCYDAAIAVCKYYERAGSKTAVSKRSQDALTWGKFFNVSQLTAQSS